MAKQTDKTKVIFRIFRDGEVIALFPEIEENAGCILSYMHIGQHGAASRDIVTDTKLATVEQYAPLYKELQSIGYHLQIRKRINR